MYHFVEAALYAGLEGAQSFDGVVEGGSVADLYEELKQSSILEAMVNVRNATWSQDASLYR